MGNMLSGMAPLSEFERRARLFFGFIRAGDIDQLRVLINSLSADELNLLLQMHEPNVRPERAALMSAILHRRTEIAVLLLERGADPHQTVIGLLNDIRCNVTPLWVAVINDNLELCRALITHGANVDLGTDSGESNLLAACHNVYENLELLSFLVESGADVNLADSDGFTPLIVASFKGKRDAVNLLLSHGANVEQTDHTGLRFSLMGAAVGGHLEVCRVLIEEWAADVNQQANNAATALLYASSYGHLAVVTYLIDHGADREHVDIRGCNALMWAVKKGKIEVARYLLGIGLRTDLIDIEGKSVRDLAEESGIVELVDLFRTADERQERGDGQQNEEQQQM